MTKVRILLYQYCSNNTVVGDGSSEINTNHYQAISLLTGIRCLKLYYRIECTQTSKVFCSYTKFGFRSEQSIIDVLVELTEKQ